MTARVYYNTGFNAVNIPLTPDVLDNGSFDYDDTPALDILQDTELTVIKLKITADKALNVDFIKLNDRTYYTVNSFSMTSADVASFYVSMSYLLTIGGAANANFSDGFVVRSTFLQNLPQDVSTIVDSLLTPSYPNFIVSYSLFNDAQSYEDKNTSIIYRDVNTNSVIGFNGSVQGRHLYLSPYKPQTDAELDDIFNTPVTVEKGEGVDTYSLNYNNTTHALGKPREYKTTIQSGVYNVLTTEEAEYIYPGVTIYDDRILNTALALYSYGVPNPITDAYILPEGFGTAGGLQGDGAYTLVYSRAIKATLKEDLFNVVWGEGDKYHKNVIGNILASCVDIKIIAVGSGETLTTKPQFLESPSQITVDMICDPSPQGAPYFKLRDRLSMVDTAASPYNYILRTLSGSVRGGSWQRVPVTYSGFGYEKNLALNRMQLKSSVANIANVRQIQENAAMRNLGIGLVGDAISIVPGANVINSANNLTDNGAAGSLISGMATQAVSGLTNMATRTASAMSDRETRDAIASESLRQIRDANALFRTANTSLQYDVQFGSINTMQALAGNGVLIQVYKPDIKDVQKYIKIMQRYGFPTNHPIGNEEDFTDAISDGYCFVQTSNAHIAPPADTIWPNRFYELAAAEIDGGKRFWTVKPDMSLYDEKYLVEEGT